MSLSVTEIKVLYAIAKECYITTGADLHTIANTTNILIRDLKSVTSALLKKDAILFTENVYVLSEYTHILPRLACEKMERTAYWSNVEKFINKFK